MKVFFLNAHLLLAASTWLAFSAGPAAAHYVWIEIPGTIPLGKEAQAYQQRADRLVIFVLFLNGDAQLVFADHAFRYQQLSHG